MPAIVNLPDGRRVRFPDGVAPEQIESALRTDFPEQFKPKSSPLYSADVPRNSDELGAMNARGAATFKDSFRQYQQQEEKDFTAAHDELLASQRDMETLQPRLVGAKNALEDEEATPQMAAEYSALVPQYNTALSRHQKANEGLKSAYFKAVGPPAPARDAAEENAYWQDKDGKLNFDPARMVEGVHQAASDGVVDLKWAWQHRNEFQKLQDQHRSLTKLQREAAGGVVEGGEVLKAGVHGLTTGAAFLAGFGPGAAGGAALTSGTGPGAFIGAGIGGLTTGSLSAWAAKKALNLAGEYNDTIKSLNASAELHPIADSVGNLLAFSTSAPKSIYNLAKTARIANQAGESGAAVVGGVLAKGAAAGAAFEGVLRPTFDAGANAAMDMLGVKHEEWQPPTVSSLVTMAGLGAVLAGKNIKLKDYSSDEAANVLLRGKVREDAGIPMDANAPERVLLALVKRNPESTRNWQKSGLLAPLTAPEQAVYQALKTQIQAIAPLAREQGLTPEGFKVEQAILPSMGRDGGRPITTAAVALRRGGSEPVNGAAEVPPVPPAQLPAPPVEPPSAAPAPLTPSAPPPTATAPLPPSLPQPAPATPSAPVAPPAPPVVEEDAPERIPTPPPPAPEPVPVKTDLHPGNHIANTVRDKLLAGEQVLGQNIKVKGGLLGLSEKDSEEWAELGSTEAARSIAQSPVLSRTDKFDALMGLYERMPTNSTRTVESKNAQQYSTPPPLAYLGSVLADFEGGTVFAEPTAGHGMLLIGAATDKPVFANELDEGRWGRLRRYLAGQQPARMDATTAEIHHWLKQNGVDRVGQNPPFGSVLDPATNAPRKFPIINAVTKAKETTSIDLAIALNTFEAMKPDGKGFAIIGAKTGTPFAAIGSDKERAKDYQRPVLMEFFQRFKVVDWFTIGGDLYRKMGAGWPVDMIIVHGKGRTPSTDAGGFPRPWVNPPRVIETWEELRQLIPDYENRINTGRTGAGEAGGRPGGTRVGTGTGGATGQGKPPLPAERPQRPAVGGGAGGGTPAQPPERPAPAPKPPAGVPGDSSTGIGAGTPEPPQGVAGGGAKAPAPQPPAVGGERPVAPRPSPDKPEQSVVEKKPAAKPSVPVEGLPASLMVPYQSVSKGPSLSLVAPRNIATQMRQAAEDLQREVGMPLDEYVASRLGRDVKTLHTQLAGAQVDAAALAIRNIERGSALITADETGVGKGRVVAALITYAQQRGLVPIFVTAKPNLYSDMVSRDLAALGNKTFKPFITNGQFYFEDANGGEHKGTRSAATMRDLMDSIIRTGNLPEGAHGIFTTFDQLKSDKPPGFSEKPKDKFRRKNRGTPRPDGPRFALLRAIAPRAIFILDEAHLAAGPGSEINLSLSTILPSAKGIYYSSATFAKRPDNLGLYALGTSIKLAGLNHEQLTEALQKGGVPLQQALTSMLASSGELVRRQQDWTGVQMQFKSTSADPAAEIEAADTYTSFIRDLMSLAKLVNKATETLADNENQVRPKDVSVDISPITFGSRLFNLSNQYLFSLRADAVANEAIASLKAGRKPFIHVHNTLEGPINDLKARKLPMSFNGLLLREMQKMLVITVKDPMEEDGKREVTLEPEDLPDGGAFYRRLEAQIKGTDMSRFPLSPIDAIKRKIQAAAYSIGEITARDGELDDTGEEAAITKREKQNRNKTLKAYNDGQLDVLLINGSGGTGLSAHTDPKFKDQRQREYIEAQPAPDINEEMQAMGRTMRSGQTSKPRYNFLTTALAAERRFATMLRGKMSSLNANTTAEAESGMTQTEGFADDVFNVVGDEVVFRVMQANQDLANLMELDTEAEDNEVMDGYARYATGRFVLLPNAAAQRLWDEIVREFKQELEQLDERGENPLRATAEDLRARTIETSNIVEGTGTTPFDGPAVLEKAIVRPPKAPPSHAEAVQMASANLPTVRAHGQEWIKQSKAAEEERIATARQRGSTEEQIDRIKQTFTNVRVAVTEAFRKVGDTFGVDSLGDGSSAYYGVAVDLKLAGKSASDFSSASRQQLVLRTNTYKGRLTIPLSKLYKDGTEQQMLNLLDEDEAAERFNTTAESTTERHIITGNLLRGWEAADSATSGDGAGRPRVAIFTREDGSLATGILMPPGWAQSEAPGEVPIGDVNTFLNYFRQQSVMRSTPMSAVHPVQVVAGRLSVPSAGNGKILWGDPAFGTFFEQSPQQLQGNFVGYIRPNMAGRLFEFLQSKGVRLVLKAPEHGAAMRGGGGGAASRGAFVTGASKAPGAVPVAVTFGGLKFIKPFEFPELVRLVNILTGTVPKVRKIPQRGKAVTMGYFGDRMITLDARIFKDPASAALVLAHEIGHLVDYLPHDTLRRGNLLGRLLALRDYLRHNFGALNNKELRAELIGVTQWWRPYDAASDPPSYVKYRESAEELYADALSVLMNAPAELEKRAPKFYKAFWENLDKRPTVRDALFQLQELLSKGKVGVLAQRAQEMEAGFEEGEARWKALVELRKSAKLSAENFWTGFWQSLYWNFFPLEQRAARLEARGVNLPFEEDPRVFLDDLGYKDVRMLEWGRHFYERVLQPVETAGMSDVDFGKYLQFDRIIHGDRSELANPGGISPADAQLGLLQMQLGLGMAKMTVLRDAVQRFHEVFFDLTKQLVEAGAINREMFKLKIEPNKDHYAAFAILDYLEDFVPAGVKAQIGTLKKNANPLQATLLKAISSMNLIALQTAKNKTVDFLNNHFPGTLEKWPHEHEPPPKRDRGVFWRLEDGKRGWYYTDPYIADAFSKLPPRLLEWMGKPLNWVFDKIYPLIITYNVGFGYALSPMRDQQRTTRNLPGLPALPQHKAALALGIAGIATGGALGATLGGSIGASVGGLAGAALISKVLARFGGAVGQTAGRYTGPQTYPTTGKHGRRTYTGVGGPLIREMEAALGLGTPFDVLQRQHRNDFMADLLVRMRVMSSHEQQGFFNHRIFQPVRGFLDGVELGSMTLDQSLKVEAFQYLVARGKSRREAAHFVRNYVGLPNINKKGSLIRIFKPLIRFLNVAMQGWRADIKIATNPKTAAGWWMKYMLTNGLVRMLLAIAATGALGMALKKRFDAISEYMKSNYLALPVGEVPGGEFGSKQVIVTIPEDETARVIGGMISKVIRKMGPDEVKSSGLLDFTLGQFPSLNPAITVPAAWGQALTGHNPVNGLTGRPIVPRTEWDAGGANILVPMAGWTVNQVGVLNFYRYNPQANSTTELNLGTTPGINKFLRITDQGYREQQEAVQDFTKRIRTSEVLALSKDVQSLYHEYGHLQSLPRTARSEAQEARLYDLQYWHTAIYRPYWEDIVAANEDKKPAAASAARAALDKDSREFRKAR